MNVVPYAFMKHNLYGKTDKAEMKERKNLKALFIEDHFHFCALMIILVCR